MGVLIAISCSYDQKQGRYFLPEAYIEAVIKAGGTPVVLPGSGEIKKITPYLDVMRGLVLSGGGDVDPTYFGEEPHPALGEITPNRDRFESMIVKTAMRKKIPILAICRGIQILNIACGGRVIQHIPSEINRPLKHSQSAPRWYPSHKVLIEKGSRLFEIMRTHSIRVNSFHHQSVREPAPGFKVCAMSRDGVVEAIEHSGHPFVIGVQWHPECMIAKDRKSRLLFKTFVEAAGNRL